MASEQPPEKPPAKRKGSIDLKTYEALAHAYLIGGARSVRTLSAAVGVSKQTAMRAISTGWPERNWPSLKERAELIDRQTARGTAPGDKPRVWTTEEIQSRKVYDELKAENISGVRGAHGLARQFVPKIMDALGRATADRIVQRRRVIDVRVGRKVVQRVVVEDVVVPPSLWETAQAARAVVEMIARTSEVLRRWAGSGPGDFLDTPISSGWNEMTDEQLEHVRTTGKLPPGFTIEGLRSKK